MIHERSVTRNTQPQGIPVYLPGVSKPIGHVIGADYFRYFSRSRHMLRRPPAIAFDVSTLHDAQAAGAQYAVLRDLESGSLYRAPIETIFRYGFRVLRGHGEQIALELDRWSIDGRPPRAERKDRLDLQLGLFSGSAT